MLVGQVPLEMPGQLIKSLFRDCILYHHGILFGVHSDECFERGGQQVDEDVEIKDLHCSKNQACLRVKVTDLVAILLSECYVSPK